MQGNYSVFQNLIELELNKKNIKILADDDSTSKKFPVFNYIINDAGVVYSDLFRKSFLGDFFTERKINIKGSFFIKEFINNEFQTNKYDFEEVYTDTIEADILPEVENQAYPFTRGELPAEPFLSSLWEPVVAIGAAAVAIYLFFSIRSK